jgi:hypothetical protein
MEADVNMVSRPDIFAMSLLDACFGEPLLIEDATKLHNSPPVGGQVACEQPPIHRSDGEAVVVPLWRNGYATVS